MIAYIEGQVLHIENICAVILVNGVGYQLNLTKPDLDKLSPGENAHFFVHTNVKEDAIELFGFSSKEQKQVFQLLIGVSGVGPKLALTILSTLSAGELSQALVQKNTAILSSISGIGKKTAERLALELNEKIQKLNLMPIAITANTTAQSNLLQALKSLGYSKDQCEKVVASIDAGEFIRTPLEDLVRKSLNLLTGP
ncbi:MAG: Holliday junction branch migration protein RuvA [Myxococcales bacterium]|nr:MAG: Holliday junction branch migration protein RuvA [Myxococcales bacterium]